MNQLIDLSSEVPKFNKVELAKIVLISLVWPGLGCLLLGHYWKAALLSCLALVVIFTRGVVCLPYLLVVVASLLFTLDISLTILSKELERVRDDLVREIQHLKEGVK